MILLVFVRIRSGKERRHGESGKRVGDLRLPAGERGHRGQQHRQGGQPAAEQSAPGGILLRPHLPIAGSRQVNPSEVVG